MKQYGNCRVFVLFTYVQHCLHVSGPEPDKLYNVASVTIVEFRVFLGPYIMKPSNNNKLPPSNHVYLYCKWKMLNKTLAKRGK